MIKRIILTSALLMGSLAMAQVNTFVDAFKKDATIQVIGVQEDATGSTYSHYNFILDQPSKIDREKYNLEYGYETANRGVEEENFMVYIVKDKKIIDQWLVNPKLYNVFHNGDAFSFDSDKLQNLATKYPLNYLVERLKFKNEKEFTKIKKGLYQDVSALIIIDPEFTYEGSFDMSFPRNEQFKSPEAIEAFLRPQIEKLTKNNFVISYAITEKNFLDPNQFTLTISSDENTYKKLAIDKVVKQEWIADVYEAIVYRKK